MSHNVFFSSTEISLFCGAKIKRIFSRNFCVAHMFLRDVCVGFCFRISQLFERQLECIFQKKKLGADAPMFMHTPQKGANIPVS